MSLFRRKTPKKTPRRTTRKKTSNSDTDTPSAKKDYSGYAAAGFLGYLWGSQEGGNPIEKLGNGVDGLFKAIFGPLRYIFYALLIVAFFWLVYYFTSKRTGGNPSIIPFRKNPNNVHYMNNMNNNNMGNNNMGNNNMGNNNMGNNNMGSSNMNSNIPRGLALSNHVGGSAYINAKYKLTT